MLRVLFRSLRNEQGFLNAGAFLNAVVIGVRAVRTDGGTHLATTRVRTFVSSKPWQIANEHLWHIENV